MAEAIAEWTSFAWRRFALDVPLEWEPGIFDGDDLRGYVRLEDYFEGRLEMRWRRSYRAGNIEVAAKRYVEGIRQGVKRRRLSFKMEPKEYNLVPSWPDDFEARVYRWSADVDCVSAIVQCSACHRLTAIQLLFPLGGLKPALAKRVLSSFRDHVEEGEGDAWRLYLSDIVTPHEWRLKDHQFGPGILELNFGGPRRMTASFRRWGAAEVLLAGRDMRRWFNARWPKGIRPEKVVETEVRGEPALVATRNPRGVFDLLRRLIGRKEASKKSMFWQGVAWHCEQSNRLWAVDVFAPTEAEATEAAWEVRCHAETF